MWTSASALPDLGVIEGERASEPEPATRRAALGVVSAKGGVGTTTLSANLALCLAELGRDTLLVDAHLGLGELHEHLGVTPNGSVIDCLSSDSRRPSPTPVARGLALAAAGLGDAALANLDEVNRQRLWTGLRHEPTPYDLLVYDVPSGITRPVIQILACVDRALIVTSPSRAAIARSCALVETLATRRDAPLMSVVFNLVDGEADLPSALRTIDGAARAHGSRITVIGVVPVDLAVPRSVSAAIPVVRNEPYAPAARAVRDIARRLFRDPHLAATNEARPLSAAAA